jgi:hypothetical protein
MARPSRRQPVFHRKLEQLQRRHDVASVFEEMIEAIGGEFTHADYSNEGAFGGCGWILVRFGRQVEESFGLKQEILVFFSPYRDLQKRTFLEAKRIAYDNQRAARHLILFFSPDPEASTKLRIFAEEFADFEAAPLTEKSSSDIGAFMQLLREFRHERNLFAETRPVSGRQFFGRKSLIRDLVQNIREQRTFGLFGLRKSGKTSVLQELQEAFSRDANRYVIVIIDLQDLPSPPEDPTRQYLSKLRSRLLSAISKYNHESNILASIPEYPSIEEFKGALETVLSSFEKQNRNIVLFLDEIEHLVPGETVDIREGAFSGVSRSFGMLRSISQERKNFSFGVCGITSSIVESDRLYGRPNPLYSWADPYYIGPLDKRDLEDLSRTLGSPMGLRFLPTGIDKLVESTGGYPFLYRNFVAHIVNNFSPDTVDRIIDSGRVLTGWDTWQRDAEMRRNDMFSHLERYYETEYLLLRYLENGDGQFSRLAIENVQAVDHLIKLGLISDMRGEYRLNPFLEIFK